MRFPTKIVTTRKPGKKVILLHYLVAAILLLNIQNISKASDRILK